MIAMGGALWGRHDCSPGLLSRHPIDTVLQELQHREHQRNRLPRAMESKAATASCTSLSAVNYFQMQIEQAQRAHKLRSHYPNKSPQGSRPGGLFNHQGVLVTDTSDRDELVRLAYNSKFSLITPLVLDQKHRTKIN